MPEKPGHPQRRRRPGQGDQVRGDRGAAENPGEKILQRWIEIAGGKIHHPLLLAADQHPGGPPGVPGPAHLQAVRHQGSAQCRRKGVEVAGEQAGGAPVQSGSPSCSPLPQVRRCQAGGPQDGAAAGLPPPAAARSARERRPAPAAAADRTDGRHRRTAGAAQPRRPPAAPPAVGPRSRCCRTATGPCQRRRSAGVRPGGRRTAASAISRQAR